MRAVSAAGLRESHVHDVIITKEAPNYRLSKATLCGSQSISTSLFHLGQWDQRLVPIPLDRFFEIAQVFQIFDTLP